MYVLGDIRKTTLMKKKSDCSYFSLMGASLQQNTLLDFWQGNHVIFCWFCHVQACS